jgi:hypothetical protein
MKRKRYLYHVTEPKNIEAILRDGLRRSMGHRTTMAVYLSEKPMSWYTDGMEILKVDVSELEEMKATTFLPDSDEVLFWGDIPAWKMTKNGWKPRISVVTDMYVGRKKGV